MALEPAPQSTDLAAVMYKSRREALKSEEEPSRRVSSSATESSKSSSSYSDNHGEMIHASQPASKKAGRERREMIVCE